MSKLFYFLATFAESGLSVFGIRGTYAQPAYKVIQTIASDVELRAYPPRTVAETTVDDSNEGEAFGRLFRYIAGANRGEKTLSMTVPVEQTPHRLAMTVPVETGDDGGVMRFYLPAGDIPQPTDPHVRIVTLPATTLGVVRYSGSLSETTRAKQTARLRAALAQAGRAGKGAPIYLAYDPPFTVPFLRRNEVALQVEK